MRHARAVMHVGIAYLWWWGKVPGIPSACASAILRIWQEAHSDTIKSRHNEFSYSHGITDSAAMMCQSMRSIVSVLGKPLL